MATQTQTDLTCFIVFYILSLPFKLKNKQEACNSPITYPPYFFNIAKMVTKSLVDIHIVECDFKNYNIFLIQVLIVPTNYEAYQWK